MPQKNNNGFKGKYPYVRVDALVFMLTKEYRYVDQKQLFLSCGSVLENEKDT